jgi:acetyl-CoA synthetase
MKSEEELSGILKQQVRQDIGSFAIPSNFQIVSGLPKTRSGKIMRRILKKIAVGEYDDLGNITTLADSSVVEELINLRK